MRLLLAIAVLSVSVLAATPASPARAAAHAKHCRGTFGPRGEPGQGFWRAIRARRVGCRHAKRVIRAYLHTGGGNHVVRGYHCRIRITTSPSDPDGTGRLRCKRGRRWIRATGHP